MLELDRVVVTKVLELTVEELVVEPKEEEEMVVF